MLDTRESDDQQQPLVDHAAISSKSPSTDDHGVVDKSTHCEHADATNSDSSPPSKNTAVSAAAAAALTQSGTHRTGRWTPDEKILFLYGLKRFGKGRWKKMSIYLPHRSLVQIKSHAQKVLKRLEQGENVFRRLDENYGLINQLILQAAKEQLAGTASDKCISSEVKKTKRTTTQKPSPPHTLSAKPLVVNSGGSRVTGVVTPTECKHQNTADSHGIRADAVPSCIQNANSATATPTSNITEHGRGAVIAAAALCQLSALGGGAWDSSCSASSGGSLQRSC